MDQKRPSQYHNFDFLRQNLFKHDDVLYEASTGIIVKTPKHFSWEALKNTVNLVADPMDNGVTTGLSKVFYNSQRNNVSFILKINL